MYTSPATRDNRRAVPKKEGSKIIVSPREKELKRANASVKAARKTLITAKLKKFLSARPSPDELFERKILPSPYGPSPPLKMSIFNRIVTALDNTNAINCEGIFRISGSGENTRNIWCSLATDSYDFSGAAPHDIAGALKLYIRELVTPLVPYEHFQALLDSQRLEPAQSLVYMQKVVQLMPEENKQILKALIIYLEKVAANSAVNKMTSHNLAVCFGPNVLRSPRDGADVLADIETQCAVIAAMITNRPRVFGEIPTTAAATIPVRPEQQLPPPVGLPPPLNLPPPPQPLFTAPNPNLPFSSSNPPTPPSKPKRTMTLPPPPQVPLQAPHLPALPQLPPPPSPVQLANVRPIPPLPVLPLPVLPLPTTRPTSPLSLDYEEWSMGLIDDLSEEDKPTLVKKIASHFATDGEQFKAFLKDVLGVDGVIALLESVV